MKLKFLLSAMLLLTSLTGYSTTWTVTNSGNTYTPATITITEGDEVNFSLTVSHDVVEVSQSTWDANGNTALSGGFQLPFGGGTVSAAQLTVGTHYYECTPHASLGMKGVIIVQNSTTDIDANSSQPDFDVSLNSSTGHLQGTLDAGVIAKDWILEIYNSQGVRIHQSLVKTSTFDIDLSNQPNGIFIVKFFNEKTVLTQKLLKSID